MAGFEGKGGGGKPDGYVVAWDTQVIRKEVHGEMKDVLVIGGAVEFSTWDGAYRYSERLRETWPGVRFKIVP
ncbi:MAG: hypothetical protein ACPLRM_08105, partial [Anaerolineae bacterium]